MKKTGQVATKNKINAVQANKKKVPAKGPVVKAKTQQARGLLKKNGSKLLPAKNGKKNSEDDDEENSDEDSNESLDTPKDSEESNGVDNGDDAEMEDSDSDDVEEDDEEDAGDVQQDNDEESDDDDDEEEEDEESDDEETEEHVKQETKEEEDDDENDEDDNENDEDEAPEEVVIKKENSKEKTPAKKSKPSQPNTEDKPDNKKRKIFVKRLDLSTTMDKVKQHFASCGKIELVRISPKGPKAEAVVVFEDEAASKAAIKMHNTILDDKNILVCHANVERVKSSPFHTVLVMNPDGLTKLESAKLEKILSKCGEIESMSLVCEKNVLAFVNFKNPESTQKALKLDGTTQNGLQMKITPYFGKIPKTKVFVKNIDKTTTEEELKGVFESCGPIQKISMKRNDQFPSTAIICFEKQESYCQAFLLHEENVRGRPILLEPFSETAKGRGQSKFKKTTFKGKRPQSGMWKKGGPPQKRMKK